MNKITTSSDSFNLQDLYNDLNRLEDSPRRDGGERPAKVSKIARQSFYQAPSKEFENLQDLLNTESPITSPREQSFEGEVPPGFTGYATLYCTDGGVYVGDFKDGLCCGIGTLTY